MSVPFKNQNLFMEIIGIVLMMILITLSNAGGTSGAGSNIPLMLIFFKMNMTEAVPVSGFVAVVATMLRFILNYKKMHPNNSERNTINYEIVMITMPAVFFGSFIGVTLNHKLADYGIKQVQNGEENTS